MDNDHIGMRHSLPAVLSALAAAALLAGCGGDDKKAATKPAGAAFTDTIRIADFIYEPDPVTVKAGQKIAIANADDAPHTVTEEGQMPSFDSSTIEGKQRGSVTFSKPGTYKYFCSFHPTMKGTVTVTQ